MNLALRCFICLVVVLGAQSGFAMEEDDASATDPCYDFLLALRMEQFIPQSSVNSISGALRSFFSYRDVPNHHVDFLIQDTLVRIYTIRERIPPGENVKNWVYTVAHRVFMEDRKAFLTRVRRVKNMPVEEMPDRPEKRESNAEERAFWEHRSEQIENAKALLTAVERQVIELWAEGKSHDEIGQAVGKTPGATRITLHRGLKKIRIKLGLEEAAN